MGKGKRQNERRKNSRWGRHHYPEDPQRVECDYCGGAARLFPDSTPIYGRNYGPVWSCKPCDARVGCHPGTFVPLGRLANRQLRQMKMRVHEAFDWMWRIKMEGQKVPKQIARGKAYEWLAEQMGIPKEECHVGMFSIERCELALEVLAPFVSRRKQISEAVLTREKKVSDSV